MAQQLQVSVLVSSDQSIFKKMNSKTDLNCSTVLAKRMKELESSDFSLIEDTWGQTAKTLCFHPFNVPVKMFYSVRCNIR